MRPLGRIPLILSLFRDDNIKREYIKYQLGEYNDRALRDWKQAEEYLLEYWFQYPDLRLIQLLCLVQGFPDYVQHYYEEETDWLMQRGYVDGNNILFWTQRLDKNGKPLREPVTRLINELATDHIEAILNTQTQISAKYRKAFRSELQQRIS